MVLVKFSWCAQEVDDMLVGFYLVCYGMHLDVYSFYLLSVYNSFGNISISIQFLGKFLNSEIKEYIYHILLLYNYCMKCFYDILLSAEVSKGIRLHKELW